VAATLYGVVGHGDVLGGLRHPTMHAMQPLRHGLGLCHVRTQLAMDEPLARLPDELPRLTESVLGYVMALSERAPVIYVACDGDEEAAAGWRGGRLELGPLRSRGDPPRRRFGRGDAGAIDAALGWLGVRRLRGRDRLHAVGLAEQRAWEPGAT
jgi:hypothetical protein